MYSHFIPVVTLCVVADGENWKHFGWLMRSRRLFLCGAKTDETTGVKIEGH